MSALQFNIYCFYGNLPVIEILLVFLVFFVLRVMALIMYYIMFVDYWFMNRQNKRMPTIYYLCYAEGLKLMMNSPNLAFYSYLFI